MGRDVDVTLSHLHVYGSLMPAALVTGAATRLGKAMAIYLAERGFDVAIH